MNSEALEDPPEISLQKESTSLIGASGSRHWRTVVKRNRFGMVPLFLRSEMRVLALVSLRDAERARRRRREEEESRSLLRGSRASMAVREFESLGFFARFFNNERRFESRVRGSKTGLI